MMMMVVMMMMVTTVSRRHDHDPWNVLAILAVVMMVMVVMIKLSDLNVLAGFWRGRFVDGLQQGAGVCNRLQQVGV